MAKAEQRLFDKLNWIELQSEEISKAYSAKARLVLSGVDRLMAELKKTQFSSDIDTVEFERAMKAEMMSYETMLGIDKTIEVKRISKIKASLGSLNKPPFSMVSPDIRQM